MSNIDKRALREAAEKATKGEWWSDVVETDGEYGEGEDRVSGYHSYAVYVGHESLLDMTNSTAACIHTEWDHDYHMAWDETAKRNAEFIAAANPSTVLALLDELEAAEKLIAELSQKADIYDMLRQDYGLQGSLVDFVDWQAKRIAELSASHGKLREAMAGIHNVITGGGAYTPLAAIQNASKRAYEDSAAAAGKGEAS
ncbi:ead/Ea22-like family protein [Citrobacter sp. AAK_AS5]|nr:ead/Ea22-like family protein [Citrobacter sp. AAK_AS5]